MFNAWIDAAVVSSKGPIRSNNEDNVYFDGVFMPLNLMNNGLHLAQHSDARTQLYCVCDGMGGEARGELASYTAVALLKSYSFRKSRNIRSTINDFCKAANVAVWQASGEQSGERRCGSTFACVAIRNTGATVAHIGDSRVYRLHDGHMAQVTKDHTEAQRMVDLGILKPEKIASHPARHTLSRYLGIDPTECSVEATFDGPFPLAPGDRFLLCSDGLTEMLSDQDIGGILRAHPTSEDAAEALVNAALAAGGKDNVTVIVLSVKRGGRGRMPFLFGRNQR